MTPPSVSVVMRNRNEADSLRTVLPALRAQRGIEIEIVAVDNESTDDSATVWSEFGAAAVVGIGAGEYTPGRALNRGLAAASHEVVLILSAHSLPLHEDFLLQVARGLEDDRVAGVRCIQTGILRDAAAWHQPLELDRTASTREVLQSGPNCACCGIRRSVWQQIPFDEETMAVEDKLWTRAVLDRGYVVRRVPAAYRYLRGRSPGEQLLRDHREAVAATRRLDAPPPTVRLADVLRAATSAGLYRYLRGVAESWARYRTLRTVARDAGRRPRSGSTQ